MIHVLLLSMTAHLTKELGMAPGGEFRAAFRQVGLSDDERRGECVCVLGSESSWM